MNKIKFFSFSCLLNQYLIHNVLQSPVYNPNAHARVQALTTGCLSRLCTVRSRGGRCSPGGAGGPDTMPVAVPTTLVSRALYCIFKQSTTISVSRALLYRSVEFLCIGQQRTTVLVSRALLYGSGDRKFILIARQPAEGSTSQQIKITVYHGLFYIFLKSSRK